MESETLKEKKASSSNIMLSAALSPSQTDFDSNMFTPDKLVHTFCFSLPHSESVVVFHPRTNTHTWKSQNRCLVSGSGRCSHPCGLSQHRQCFVFHKGSSHPGSGALFGPQWPPPRSQKGPPKHPTTTCWGAKRNICVTQPRRHCRSSHTEGKSVTCIRLCEFCLRAQMRVSMFMWAQVLGSWESPSADNKWCERKEKQRV